MTNASRTTMWQIVRALAAIALSTAIFAATFQRIHAPLQPYYAQLAAKAAVSATVKDGDPNGYAYVRVNTK